MIVFPNAKINLGLFVESKRKDGFHNIQSVFYPIDVCDVLEFREASEFSLTVSGLRVDGLFEDNIVYKAWNLLHTELAIPPVEVELLKVIPMGAGLGGGSADAAFFLSGLNDYFQSKLSERELENYASRLGSDCPFFIKNKAALVEGRGERIEQMDFDLSGFHLLLLYPAIHSGTSEAYSGIQLEPEHFDLSMLNVKEIHSWREAVRNSFESSIFKSYPLIAELKERLYHSGAIYASMSGSGSSVFGLFENEPDVNDFADLAFVRAVAL